jgi:hypothetical protein
LARQRVGIGSKAAQVSHLGSSLAVADLRANHYQADNTEIARGATD